MNIWYKFVFQELMWLIKAVAPLIKCHWHLLLRVFRVFHMATHARMTLNICFGILFTPPKQDTELSLIKFFRTRSTICFDVHSSNYIFLNLDYQLTSLPIKLADYYYLFTYYLFQPIIRCIFNYYPFWNAWQLDWI